VGPVAMHQVGSTPALVGPGSTSTTADAVRDAGPTASASVRAKDGAERSGTGDTGVAAPVAAEVVEVLSSEGSRRGSPCRHGKFGGEDRAMRAGSAAQTASAQAGGTPRTATSPSSGTVPPEAGTLVTSASAQEWVR
jgi:hypothetical protein